jgi:class 3 adenylate cyclase/YHS domain-containing protein
LRESGLSGPEVAPIRDSISDQLEAMIEPTLIYFHRKAWQRAMRHDFVIHMLEEIGVEVADSTHGQLVRAVLFVDLSSFTPLTSVMGDVTAAGILERFSLAVRQVARQHDGTVVKQIGDCFMLVFLDAVSAVRAADALNTRLASEAQFPAMHGGIHYGPVLYRESDYVGTTVNVAARVVAEAGAHETVVTEAARRRAGELPNIAFRPIGTRHVKGVDEPIELYRIEGATSGAGDRRTDPVCGMQLRPNEIAVRMSIEDDEFVFCSAHCMSIFASRTPASA